MKFLIKNDFWNGSELIKASAASPATIVMPSEKPPSRNWLPMDEEAREAIAKLLQADCAHYAKKAELMKDDPRAVENLRMVRAECESRLETVRGMPLTTIDKEERTFTLDWRKSQLPSRRGFALPEEPVPPGQEKVTVAPSVEHEASRKVTVAPKGKP